ncbi:MAG: phosphoserine phosphatase SerB [Alphaproteobacteria bacterium]
MSSILTLVASDPKAHPLTKKHFKEIGTISGFYNIDVTGSPDWLAKHKAADIIVSDKPQKALIEHLRDFLKDDQIDLFVTKPGKRRKKLLLADMDSTIVSSETLDELAAYAGLKDKIAEITRRAMEGKIDFHAALRERVGLLKGLDATKLQETLQETQVNPGAHKLVEMMRANNAGSILVSGGFTFFTGAIAKEVGFEFHHGNVLEIEGGVLTGTVKEPIQDKNSKLAYLRQYCEDMGLEAEDVLAIGDGANDIPMLKAAGLGIGYYPKPAVADAIDNIILYGDLSACLYAQGYKF